MVDGSVILWKNNALVQHLKFNFAKVPILRWLQNNQLYLFGVGKSNYSTVVLNNRI